MSLLAIAILGALFAPFPVAFWAVFIWSWFVYKSNIFRVAETIPRAQVVKR